MAERAMLRLLSWLSPSFPVGSYSYSHGLEAAVEHGLVNDRDSAEAWVHDILVQGSGRQDAWLFARAYCATADGDLPRLSALSELGEALRPTAELALESRAQGEAFLMVVRRAWPEHALDAYVSLLQTSGRRAIYPIVVAVACAAHGVPVTGALAAYLHAFAANLVSAAVRLVPLGQTDGQRIMAALEPGLVAVASGALCSSRDRAEAGEDWPGTATPLVEWTSMAHETQYTRLFRS